MRFYIAIIAMTLFLFSTGNATKKTSSKQDNPKSEKQAPGNWTVFELSPQNAILHIDSLSVYNVRKGVLQVMLPFGKHKYICESPYFETARGEFNVTDDSKTNLQIDLKPLFSFLVIYNPVKNSDILIDGEKAGKKCAVSGRLNEGSHRISVVKGNVCWYDRTIYLQRGKKSTYTIDADSLNPEPIARLRMRLEGEQTPTQQAEKAMQEMKAECGGLNIHTPQPGAQILLNGKKKGLTPILIKDLYPGVRYRITLRMEGYKSVSRFVEVKTGEISDFEIKMKKK